MTWKELLKEHDMVRFASLEAHWLRDQWNFCSIAGEERCEPKLKKWLWTQRGEDTKKAWWWVSCWEWEEGKREWWLSSFWLLGLHEYMFSNSMGWTDLEQNIKFVLKYGVRVSGTPLCLGLSEPLREARARKGFRNFQYIIGDSHSGKTFKNTHLQSNSPFRVGPPNCDRHVKFIFVTLQQTCYSAISVGENISNLWPSCYNLLRKLKSGGHPVNPREFHVSCHTWGPSPVKKKAKAGQERVDWNRNVSLRRPSWRVWRS